MPDGLDDSWLREALRVNPNHAVTLHQAPRRTWKGMEAQGHAHVALTPLTFVVVLTAGCEEDFEGSWSWFLGLRAPPWAETDCVGAEGPVGVTVLGRGHAAPVTLLPGQGQSVRRWK